MGPIAEFFKSEQALAILGLPGLALLLAFTFYQALIKNKLITTVGKNQSFVILVLIITYFLIVTVLVIRVYQPPPAPAGKGVVSAEAPTAWTKLNAFFARTGLATPLSTFDTVVGPATADGDSGEEGATIRVRDYFSVNDGLLVQVAHNGSAISSIGAYDKTARLRIPTLDMGLAGDNRRSRSFHSLSDFNLETVVERCGGAELTQQFAGKFGNYAVGPCYFGRPGGYNHFAFLFWMKDGSGFTDDCSPFTLAGRVATVADIRKCGGAKERPVGFVVTRDADALEPAISSLVATVNGE